MAKIPLTIDKNYCAGWNVWHGVRELLQNAKDAEEHDGHEMIVNHYPKTNRLEIVTCGVQVNAASLLVLGKTSKGDGRYRGKFGEGFVLGVLALVRSGYDVKFRNHELSWTVSFEAPDPDHPLAGNELLTFHSRQLPAREVDFKVEVHGVSADIWAELKKLALFIEEPKPGTAIETSAGTLLLDPAYKGRVFMRGLFVRAFADLECGYNLKNIQLDRDRQMIDEWQLHYALGQLWVQACERDPALDKRVYDMAKTGTSEARHLHYHADQKLIARMKEQFEQENGEGTVPVTTTAEEREVTSVGAKPAITSPTLKDLLATAGLSIEETKRRLAGKVLKRWSSADLDDPAQDISFAAYQNVGRLEKVLPASVIVTFAGETPSCQPIDDKRLVGIDYRMLDRPFKDVLSAALVAEAERTSTTPLDVLIDFVAKLDDETEECVDCNQRIPVSERGTVNAWHAKGCAHYHPDDVPSEATA